MNTSIANDVYKEHKEKMYELVNSLRNNSNERTQIENYLNSIYTLNNSGEIVSNEDGKMFNKVIEDIGKEVNTQVTKGLDIIESEKQNFVQLINIAGKELQDKIKRIQEDPKISANASIIGKNRLKKYIETFKLALKNSNKNIGNQEARRELQKALENINRIINNNKETILGPGGYEYYSFDNPRTMRSLLKSLNTAYAVITYGDLAKKKGQIGEMFGAVATYYALNKEEDGANEIVQDFLQNMQKGNNNIRITGESKSQKVFSSELGKQFVSRYSIFEDENGVKYKLDANTDDKVDFEISVPESHKETIKFSMKNYGNISQITLLKGNIYPILDNYLNFLNHFLELTNSTDITLLDKYFGLLKSTVGIHALIGNVYAIKDDALIKTKTADYLVINKSSQKVGNFTVFSTSEVSDAILKSSSLISLNTEDIIRKPYNPAKEFDNRFSNTQVELHINQLKNSLTRLNKDSNLTL